MTDYYNPMPHSKTGLTIYYPGQAFTLSSIQYPGNWLALATDSERAALGFLAVEYGPYPNAQFYDIATVQNENIVTYVGTAKPIQPLKASMIKQADSTTWRSLQPTDYLEAPKHLPMDPALRLERDNKIASFRAYRDLVNDCTTVEQLASLAPFSLL